MQAQLKAVPIFAGLSQPALDVLLTRAEESAKESGTLVFKEGEPGNRFYLIAEGQVRVCKHYGTAGEIELAVLKANDFFGEMCILETLPRSATVIAAVASTLVSLPSVAFYHLYRQMPEQYSILVLNIARDLSRRLRHLDEVFAGRH